VGLLFEVIGVLVWSTVTRLAAWRRRRRRRGEDDERLQPERFERSEPLSIADEAHAWLERQ
jgi:hypothetical protein